MSDLTKAFSEHVLAVTPASLTAADHEQVARLLFDAAGCGYGGARQQTVTALHKWARAHAGSGKSGIVAGGFRVPATTAALVNGTATHSYELDDTHDASMSHPASVIIPAALAVAAEVGSKGDEFIAAIIAGYEAMTRIGVAANASHVIEFGFHPTALFGGFGAAAAVAKLRRVDGETLRCAWGHAVSMASGSMQFSDESTGTAVKRVHAGYAAQQGVLAVELALAGVEAPQRSLDGKYGFFAIYGRDPKPELLLANPERRAIHEISFKPYACCRQFHSMIDGLRDITDEFGKSSSISSITVRGPRVLADQHMSRRPASPMAAQYSLPFVVGATIEFGPARYDAFASSNLQNPSILRWADLVEVEFDRDLQEQYPAHFGTEVEVGFKDGSKRTERILDSRGTPALPFSWNDLHIKAASLTAGSAIPLDLDRLEQVVRHLSEAPEISEFEGLWAGTSPESRRSGAHQSAGETSASIARL